MAHGFGSSAVQLPRPPAHCERSGSDPELVGSKRHDGATLQVVGDGGHTAPQPAPRPIVGVRGCPTIARLHGWLPLTQ